MTETRQQFFDRIADQWDDRVDLDRMARAITAGLRELGLREDARVVDLGCGTGNLTRALMQHLGPNGRVWAVDFSARMIERARAKVRDERTFWIESNAEDLPLSDGLADEVLCFSAWPHFPDPRRVAREVWRLLAPGGVFTVWHALSRARVNAIHSDSGGAVEADLLPPGAELATLLADLGFRPELAIDDTDRYLVRARRLDSGS